VNADRLLREILVVPISVARKLWVARVLAENDAVAESRSWMTRMHYVEVPDSAIIKAPDADYTSDGRVVIRAHGKMWAKDAAFVDNAPPRREQPSRQSPAPVVEGVAMSACPQMVGGKPCGGALNRGPVCPGCVTGKMGYRYRYTCESCGFDIVTKTELAE